MQCVVLNLTHETLFLRVLEYLQINSKNHPNFLIFVSIYRILRQYRGVTILKATKFLK